MATRKPAISKRNLIGGLVMKTFLLFKVDAFLSYLADSNGTGITKEVAKGLYDDKGGIWLPGMPFRGLTDREEDEELVITKWEDDLDTRTWEEFEKIEPIWQHLSTPMKVICNGTSNYDSATLLFRRGVSYGHELELREKAMPAFRQMMATTHPISSDRPISKNDLIRLYAIPHEYCNRGPDDTLIEDFQKVGGRTKASIFAGYLLGHPTNFRQAIGKKIRREPTILETEEGREDILIAQPYVYAYHTTGMPESPVGLIKILGWGELGNFAVAYITDSPPKRVRAKRRTPHLFTYKYPDSEEVKVYALLDRYGPTKEMDRCKRYQTWVLSPNDIGTKYLRPIMKHGIERGNLRGVKFSFNC